MNQTKKRLSIINLAISITDIETIQLQILKLRLLQTDENIQNILLQLENQNYIQAQGLIASYIETPHKEILQRTFQEEREKQSKKDKDIIDEFDLFMTEKSDKQVNEINTLNLDDMIAMENNTQSINSTSAKNTKEALQILDLDDMIRFEKDKQSTKEHKTVNFDSLLEVNSDDILKGNINIDMSHKQNNDFWEDDSAEIVLESEDIPKDTFFDTEIMSEYQEPKTIDTKRTIPEVEEIIEDIVLKKTEIINKIPDDLKELKSKVDETEKDNDKKYKAITYIDQKLKNMQTQYPAIQNSGKRFESVDNWLMKISNDGYTELEVEEVITYIDKTKTDTPEEAAQLLLISAATESKYAKFRLARALYKGDILEKNSAESFTLINSLAVNDDYPEAICDLAQFYEHGIGIAKDKSKAELLYKEAMEAGIKRADEHFARLKKQNKSFLSFLTK